MPAPVLLVLSLAGLAWFQRNDMRGFRRFRAIEDSARRQRVFLRWARNACAMYLGVPLAGLVLLGRIDALWRFPAELLPLSLSLPDLGTGDPGFLGLMAGAVIGGGLVGTLLRLAIRGPAKAPPGLDITPMLPRNRAELLRAVPLAVNAGISEEVFFRAYLPLLIVEAGGGAALAFLVSTLIFGLLHRYQGWLGVLVTTLLGAIFALLYLGTGSLLAPILAHLLVNLNAIVLRPAIQMSFRSRTD